jgi:hypothetical protein
MSPLLFVLAMGCSGKDADSAAAPEPAPEIDVTPAELDFGDVRASDGPTPLDLAIHDVGDLELDVTSIELFTGEFFTLTTDSGTVSPGGILHVGVLFDPFEAGAQTDTVFIVSNDADEPTVQVTVRGNGT